MRQMGHTSPNLALAVYAREMDRRDGEPERLRALVEGQWAQSGTETVETTTAPADSVTVGHAEVAA
jgi:hypothetical protein